MIALQGRIFRVVSNRYEACNAHRPRGHTDVNEATGTRNFVNARVSLAGLRILGDFGCWGEDGGNVSLFKDFRNTPLQRKRFKL